MTEKPLPFRISVTPEKLGAIRDRVSAFPWDAVPDPDGWSAGASKPFMRALCSHWLERYDWAAAEERLNRYPQFRASVDGEVVHFYNVKGRGSKTRPLLLMHGWPGSVFEFHHLIDALADPAANGGDAADAFDLVIPSLPGFGFSDRPSRPLGARDVAGLMSRLMTEVLGYESFISQGGDWGGILSSWIGILDPAHCAGVHLNMVMPSEPDPSSAEEIAWATEFGRLQQAEGGYSHIQMTRPQSLGFAMADSPVGVAAWIVEKFAAWSDLPRTASGEPDLLARYSYDDLLTNIMFYLAQDSFVSATWLYHGSGAPGQLPFGQGERCGVPTGIAAFPDPVFPPPPRSMLERTYNVVRWSPMERGGHFAAMEAPEPFVAEVRAFGRQIFAD